MMLLTIKRKFAIFIYYFIAKNLPSSYFPLGMFFNEFRVCLLRNMFPLGVQNKIQKNVYVGVGSGLKIGSFCQINENVKLDNVQIGNYVMIAPGVTILGKMHESTNINVPMILQGEKTVNSTIIKDDVWLGTNAIVMPGILIEKGCIIAAGAVLTKSTEPFSIYAGIPAKLIKRR